MKSLRRDGRVQASLRGRLEIWIEYRLDDLQTWLEVWDRHLFFVGVSAAFLGLLLELHLDDGQTLFHQIGHLLLTAVLGMAHAISRKEHAISISVSVAGATLALISLLSRMIRWRNNLGSARERTR